MATKELTSHYTVSDTRQSVWTVRRTFLVNDHKVRATVRMDPYKFQSDFYVEVFSELGLAWNRVHTETSEWWETLHALSSGHLKPGQRDDLDTLVHHMVSIAEDLLS